MAGIKVSDATPTLEVMAMVRLMQQLWWRQRCCYWCLQQLKYKKKIMHLKRPSLSLLILKEAEYDHSPMICNDVEQEFYACLRSSMENEMMPYYSGVFVSSRTHLVNFYLNQKYCHELRVFGDEL